MEITGILTKKIGEREGVSKSTGNKWKTAEFLFEIPGTYPRNIAFTVRDGQTGRIAYFESMVGKTVVISFGIDAHEHEGRWYNEVGAYGVREYIVGQADSSANAGTAGTTAQPTPQGAINGGFGPSDTCGNVAGEGSNLPF